MNTYDKRTALDEINKQIAKLTAAAQKISREIETDEALEKQKAELIQADQNLADDIIASKAEIADHETAINAVKDRIQALSAKRVAIHREWCEKFTNNAGTAPDAAEITAEDVFKAYICAPGEQLTPYVLTPYDRQQLKKFRCLLRGERMLTSIYDREPITLVEIANSLDANGDSVAAAFVRNQPGWSRIAAS